MAVNKGTVKVTIYGMEYSVRAGDDVEYIKSVAKYVDSIMSEIDKSTGKKTPLTVSILAALNIADELMREREEKKKIQELMDKDSLRLIEKIDEKIQSIKE